MAVFPLLRLLPACFRKDNCALATIYRSYVGKFPPQEIGLVMKFHVVTHRPSRPRVYKLRAIYGANCWGRCYLFSKQQPFHEHLPHDSNPTERSNGKFIQRLILLSPWMPERKPDTLLYRVSQRQCERLTWWLSGIQAVRWLSLTVQSQIQRKIPLSVHPKWEGLVQKTVPADWSIQLTRERFLSRDSLQ